MPNNLKVGVITMHRVNNYGSFLQAYATQKIIEDLGYDCEIIDYVFPSTKHKNKNIGLLYRIFLKALSLHRSIKRSVLNQAIKKYLKLSKTYTDYESIHESPPKYDIYVTGSDQTFNHKHIKDDSTFLLSFAPIDKKKVAFSASYAQNSPNNPFLDMYKKYLPLYDAIALRESSQCLQDLVKVGIVETLDPTLILNKNMWVQNFDIDRKKKSDFIVFYMMSYTFDPTPYIFELLKELQISTGLKVITFNKIPHKYNIDKTYISTPSIAKFLYYFSEASYVVTNSFHGTAFSVNFGVPLYSVIDDNANDCRQASLLTALNIKNCIVRKGTPFKEVSPNYNKESVNIILDRLRKSSISFLKGAFNG